MAAAVPPPADCEAATQAVERAPSGDDLWTRKSLGHRAVVHVTDTFLDLYSSALTFALHLFTFETLLLCVLAAGSVSFYCKWYTDNGAPAAASCDSCAAPADGMGSHQVRRWWRTSTGRSSALQLCFR